MDESLYSINRTLRKLGVFLFFLFIIPVIMFSVKQLLNTHQPGLKKNVLGTETCSSAPTHTVIAIDQSAETGSQPTRLDQAKIVAKEYIDKLASNPQNKVTIMTFAAQGTETTLVDGSSDFAAIKVQIDNIQPIFSPPCILCAIQRLPGYVPVRSPEIKYVVLLLTDGGSTVFDTGIAPEVVNLAKLTSAPYYTLALLSNRNSQLLSDLANATGGNYHFLGTDNDAITQIYTAAVDPTVAIYGAIFQDTNGNGSWDTGEPTLNGRSIKRYNQTGGYMDEAVSDTNGKYTFSACRNTTYTIKADQQDGWIQTLPATVNGYTSGFFEAGSASSFGFRQATSTNVPTPPATPPANAVSFVFAVGLHGIGNSGDNVNPTGGGNLNPRRTQRVLTLELFQTNGQIVKALSVPIQYNTTTHLFDGNALISDIPHDVYKIKMKVSGYLRNEYASLVDLTPGTVYTLPSPMKLVAGDSNDVDDTNTRNFNFLNLQDYNTLLDCFTTSTTPNPRDPNCTNGSEKKGRADLNDDGNVDYYDINLYIRELSVQGGA